ncbi:hydrogenase maturation nickel metallochaperone HypA [soil metagenome]
MHELALLTSVVRAVERATVEAGGPAPSVVALRVGSLSGADPEALGWAWPLALAGSPVAGARLVLEPVPAAVWCPGCDREVEIDEYYALRCPECDRPTADLVRGRELEIAYVEVEEPEHDVPPARPVPPAT